MIENMKRTIKILPTLCAAAFYAVVLAGPSAKANTITGSIAFSSLGVTVADANNPADVSLSDATTFSVVSPYVANNPLGAYSAVPALTDVTFNGFTFNPPVASITTLWTFDYNGLVYSFDATSVSADYNASINEWDIGGTGEAMITGYTTTYGTWTVNLSQTDASFAFDATAGASGVAVPDGGSGVALLGSAFLGLSVFGRKFCC
jgi:hypothetical protein